MHKTPRFDVFPVRSAHIIVAEFMYPTSFLKQLYGKMTNPIAESGGNKSQLSTLVEALCRLFRRHDDKEELKKFVEWQNLMKTKIANKESPTRPDVAFKFPPS